MSQMAGHKGKSRLTPTGCSLPSDKVRARPRMEGHTTSGLEAGGGPSQTPRRAPPAGGTSQTLPGLLGSWLTQGGPPDPRQLSSVPTGPAPHGSSPRSEPRLGGAPDSEGPQALDEALPSRRLWPEPPGVALGARSAPKQGRPVTQAPRTGGQQGPRRLVSEDL